MKFFNDNFADLSSTTLTESSEVSTLPVENVQHEHLTRVWRTGASSADENVVIDLGSAMTVTAFIVKISDWTGLTSIAIQGNAADSWGTPSVDESITAPTSPALTYVDATLNGNYRYWRFKFTKNSASDQIDVQRIFLGSFLEVSNLIEYDGVQDRLNDLSRTSRSRGGQTFSEEKDSVRELGLSLSNVTDAQFTSLVTGVWNTHGTYKPLWVEVSEYSTGTGPTGGLIYGKLTDRLSRDDPAYTGSGFVWDVDLSIEEQL